MSRSTKTRAVFLSAITLLCFCCLATYSSFSYFRAGERAVTHTQEIRGALGDLEAAIGVAGRAGMGYLMSDNQSDLNEYKGELTNVAERLGHLRELTMDNPIQVKNCDEFEAITRARQQAWAESILQKQRGSLDLASVLNKFVDIGKASNVLSQKIRDEESRLLAVRTRVAHERFAFVVLIVTASFLLALFLLFLHYKWLWDELQTREKAERMLATSEQSLRDLSVHLLRSQDEERRRIGRELHDSLGQYLAALKMNLEGIEPGSADGGAKVAEQIFECVHLSEEALREVRTISYLLYPPMLEELGLKSTIPWYLDGFSKRSSIQTTFEVGPDFGRLTPEVELAFFRVLQESLTNVHRHSGSGTARVRLSTVDGLVALQIEDKGRGLPVTTAQPISGDGARPLGVGLRGMSERIRQLGGTLEVLSTNQGTTVTAKLRLAEAMLAQ